MTMRTSIWGLLIAVSACSGPGPDAPPTTGPITGNGGTGVQGNTPFPCEVGAVLQSKCWDCHGDPTNYGAPMHLMNWESVQRTTKDGLEPIYKRIGSRIHSPNDPMPPPTYPNRPSQSQLDVLDAWVAAGAPAGNGCQAPGNGGSGNGGAGGASNGGASNGTGGTYYATGGTAGDGGTSAGGSGTGGVVFPPGDEPVEPAASECEYVNITARQDAGGAKFNVPSGEQYYCFSYHVNSMNGSQALAFYPQIDNTNVIHHWLLYRMASSQPDGAVNSCLGTHADGELVAGWAPGGGEWFMPPSVGIDTGTGDFLLEVHYNNTGAPTQDASGVKVCRALANRPNTAGISWLGTESIAIPPGAQNYDVPSNCKPNTTEDIHILTTWPHMHKLGVHMTAKIHRNGGTVDTLIDEPFNFNYQRQYTTPTVLHPGEWIENHCYFTNTTGATVGFMENTSAEMCYDFVLAYPANRLVGWNFYLGGPLAQLHTTACNTSNTPPP